MRRQGPTGPVATPPPTPRWEILQLMNVGLDPGACLLIISEPEPRPHKHSASRLRRRTTRILRCTGLLIALFSPFRQATGGEQSRTAGGEEEEVGEVTSDDITF